MARENNRDDLLIVDESVHAVACPTVGMESVVKTVKALFSFRKSAGYKEVAAAAGIHPAHVSKSLSTAKEIGLAKTPHRGLYELTSDGAEYARSITIGKQEESQRVLQLCIMRNPLWKDILAFLETRRTLEKPVEWVELAADVERRVGKRWSQSMREQTGRFLMSILAEAKLVDFEGNVIFSLLSSEEIGRPQSQRLGAYDRVQPSQQSAQEMSTAKGEYRTVDYSPDFVIRVRVDRGSIEFLEKYVESSLGLWLERVRKLVEPSERQGKDESLDQGGN